MENIKIKKAYKGFDVTENNELICIDKIYKVGKTSSVSGELQICKNGIHFCWNLNDVHDYYNIKEKVVCEIEVLGDVINANDMKKSCTDKIKVLRILTKEEIFKMSNSGVDNTGVINSGDCNSGYCNSGDCNSGNHNSGNHNSGNHNSGNRNSGNRNSGSRNIGYCNSGDCNSGSRNIGYCNSGDCNSGNHNSGIRNSGDCNSGYCNSANFDGNVFCEKQHKTYIFDKLSDITLEEFYNSKWYNLLCIKNFNLTEWIYYTQEEKESDKSKELIGGYLKTNSYKDAWAGLWDQMTDKEKETIKEIPNFDSGIFERITGINVEEDN